MNTELPSSSRSRERFTCPDELRRVREELEDQRFVSSANRSQYKAIFVAFIVVSGILVSTTAFLAYQNAELREDLTVKSRDYKNFNGYFYSLLLYDTQNGLDTKSINVTVSYDTYFQYSFMAHPLHNYSTFELAFDVLEGYCVVDDTVTRIANSVKGNCSNPSDNEEVVNAILSLVQDRGSNTPSIHYIEDVEDVAKYPIETLVESVGDCEDMVILFVSLLKSLGFEPALIGLDGHLLGGVYLATPPANSHDSPASYMEDGGKRYYFAETTGYGWFVGDLPPEIADETFYIRPV